jgi:Regulator of chromosome condensation (RCC1) repeat
VFGESSAFNMICVLAMLLTFYPVHVEDGMVFCWGWNKYGQVLPSPFSSFWLTNIFQGFSYNFLLSSGMQLGLGDAIDRNIPSQVQIESYKPLNVSCGWWHTLVLAESPS